MARFFLGLLLSSLTAVALAACDSGSGGASVPAGNGACSQYTTCASCTPVQGCGWCFDATSGACVTDPDQCSGASEFTWTWDPSGCPGVDAGVVPLDGAAHGGHGG